MEGAEGRAGVDEEGERGVVYLVVGDLVTVGWNEEYLEILRRDGVKREEALRGEKGDRVLDGDDGEVEAGEQLMEDGKSREARTAAPEKAISQTAEEPEPTTAKSLPDRDADEPDYISDSDDAFETLEVSAEKADQRRVPISAPEAREELHTAAVQHNQNRNKALPWLPNDPTQALKLTLLRSIPNLPYKQNWMVNVLAVVVSLSDVQPAHIPPHRQRTARLADPSTTKQVHLATFLNPETFTPDYLANVCHYPGPAKMQANVHAILCIAEIGEMIMSYLQDRGDLYSACLTSKSFNAAARSHLWRSVHLPDLLRPGYPFWERFSFELETYTQSLYVDMKTAAPDVLDKIRTRPWASPVCDPEWLAVKEDVDKLFHGLEETTKRSARLRSFAARDVPRILDLILLVHRYCPAIEAISITACMQDNLGLRVLPVIDWQNRTEGVGRGIEVPLANMANLGLDPAMAPEFDFSNLRTLSLTNLHLHGPGYQACIASLIAILKASPNLAYLELASNFECGRAETTFNWIIRLHKISWPWMRGLFLTCLHEAGSAYFSKVIVRIIVPEFPDWIEPEIREPIATYSPSNDHGRPLGLHGLVLPSENMTPEDADLFMTMLQWVKPMRSLKIRLPHVTVDGRDDKSNEVFGRFAKMDELCELWLTDGLESPNHELGDSVNGGKEQLQVLALKFAVTCTSLSYLRIFDQAWHIRRTEAGDGTPKLLPLTSWEVENELPYAFDYRTPLGVR
ncbi:hypothetical protein MMYC01_206315 [Madurella mycetomatis]|uniref:F-box domain-containing protein n=1 Tax=Madurella mycetomatis TaxID=100816 RepID=A0A175W0M3_9PEZI|nr:hypothetical protein MMYC01_206315 [Madurella mycetomatis]